MLVWTLVIAVTVIACGALYYAARMGAVNAGEDTGQIAERAHQKSLLTEIDRAEAEGQLSPDDAAAARAELAREVVRAKTGKSKGQSDKAFSPAIAASAVAAVAIVSIGTYFVIGAPELPSQPLQARSQGLTMPPEVADAVAKVEEQLEKTPEDVRGWKVLAPVYLQVGRYEEAIDAYRRILALEGDTPDGMSDLAEALRVVNNGVLSPESEALFQRAAEADPFHVRSRFYLASEAMRTFDYLRAAQLWREVLNLSDGTETWRATAEQGLMIAEAGGEVQDDPEAQSAMIEGMVEGLAARLESDGGTIDEWVRLVRAYLVLNNRELAQKAYDDAKAAYPDANERGDLDALATQNGLE